MLWTARMCSSVTLVHGHNWWGWFSTVFCPEKNLLCQWNTCVFKSVCSPYFARSLLKISAGLMPSVATNLIMMCCATDERTSCSVIVLLTRCTPRVRERGWLQTLPPLSTQALTLFCSLTELLNNNSGSYLIHPRSYVIQSAVAKLKIVVRKSIWTIFSGFLY